MISLVNVRKEFDVDGVVTHALRGVSFEIAEGGFVAIVGPSGSGKSTLLHILSFLDRPTAGSYTFFGKSISDLSDRELACVRNKEMGFVFQSFNLLGRSSVYENVEMPLLYSDVSQKQRIQMVEAAVESVGLAEKMRHEAGRLSGGQKQRVAIARALVNDPAVLFADEPTGNLDSQSGAQVMHILERLHQTGRTVILVTHETYTAAYAERIIRLKDGVVESDEKVSSDTRVKNTFFK